MLQAYALLLSRCQVTEPPGGEESWACRSHGPPHRLFGLDQSLRRGEHLLPSPAGKGFQVSLELSVGEVSRHGASRGLAGFGARSPAGCTVRDCRPAWGGLPAVPPVSCKPESRGRRAAAFLFQKSLQARIVQLQSHAALQAQALCCTCCQVPPPLCCGRHSLPVPNACKRQMRRHC